MKKIIFLIILLLISGGALIAMAKNFSKQGEVCFKNLCFNVKIARTPQEQSRGLMFVKNLNQNEGMLFVFKKEELQSFIMQNTLIPLDMIWIDRNGKVVFISENNPPGDSENFVTINPDSKALYVLEINAGLVQKSGLNLGDKIEIKI